jgi:hypothetical protein
MSGARNYREKAALCINAASNASNEKVRATLLRLAQGALRAATEMEGLRYGRAAGTRRDPEARKISPAPISPSASFKEANEKEQYGCTDESVSNKRYHPYADVDIQAGEQPITNKSTRQPDD